MKNKLSALILAFFIGVFGAAINLDSASAGPRVPIAADIRNNAASKHSFLVYPQWPDCNYTHSGLRFKMVPNSNAIGTVRSIRVDYPYAISRNGGPYERRNPGCWINQYADEIYKINITTYN